MINIDTYACASQLKKVNPLQKFLFALSTLGVCLWADTIVTSLLVLLLMAWVTIRMGGTPFSVFLKLLLVPFSFLILGVITLVINISSNSQDFLFAFPIANLWFGVTKGGIVEATHLFFRVLGSVSCLYFLSLSTPIVDVLVVLRRLKMPQLMVEMMSLVYRYIFVLLDTANTMFIAQSSRLGYINVLTGYRSLGALVSTVFLRAYKRSNDLYTSLEARGYAGELNVLEEPFESKVKFYFAIAGVNLILIVVALSLK